VDEQNDIDELIGKYLAGEASASEDIFVKSWMEKSDVNKKYFDHLQVIFQRSAVVKSQRYNADEAWEKVKKRLHEKESRSIPLHPARNPQNRFLKIAASIIVVVAFGYFFYSIKQSVDEKFDIVTDAATTNDTLPDGSGVYLNKATQLTYSFDKKKNAHVVKLKGEAYFNIQHHDDKGFLVDAGGVFVKDIGTSFNVKAYPDSSTIEVVVEEGEVMFYTDTDSGLYLRKNGRGLYNKITKTFTVASPDPNITSYKTKFFSFTDADLSSVINTVNNVYDTKILLSDSIGSCHITVTFDQDSAEEIANIIAETLDLEVSKTANGILLSGLPCESR
jgi:transmembrane sensor